MNSTLQQIFEDSVRSFFLSEYVKCLSELTSITAKETQIVARSLNLTFKQIITPYPYPSAEEEVKTWGLPSIFKDLTWVIMYQSVVYNHASENVLNIINKKLTEEHGWKIYDTKGRWRTGGQWIPIKPIYHKNVGGSPNFPLGVNLYLHLYSYKIYLRVSNNSSGYHTNLIPWLIGLKRQIDENVPDSIPTGFSSDIQIIRPSLWRGENCYTNPPHILTSCFNSYVSDRLIPEHSFDIEKVAVNFSQRSEMVYSKILTRYPVISG